MSIIADAFSCRWGSVVAYIVLGLTGGFCTYVLTIIAVPIAAILRVRNSVRTDDAIDRFFGFRPMDIIRDSRNIRHAADQPRIMQRQYHWIFTGKAFTQLFILGAVFFTLAGAFSNAVCRVPYNPVVSSPPQAQNEYNTDVNTEVPPESANVDTPYPAVPEAVVSRPAINVRAGPTTDSRVVHTLSFGDSVSVLGKNTSSTWVKIQTTEEIGWVRSDLLEFRNVGLAEIPYVTDD